jgi:tetratricopeptide (TPR) repeat protein
MNTIDRALALDEQSVTLESEGRLEEAEACCREALRLFLEAEGETSPDVANLLNSLATILGRQGKHGESEQCARRALVIIEPLVPLLDGHTGRAVLVRSLELLGAALREQGRYAQAEPPLRRAIEEAGLVDPEALVGALNQFGILCKFWGKFEEGAGAYAKALEIALGLYGEKHTVVATLHHNIGGLEHARGRFAEAAEPARKAYEIRRELCGEDHPDTAADGSALAGVLDGLNRRQESRPMYERALRVFGRLYGDEHYEIAANLHNLAALEVAEGNWAAAERLYRRSLAIKEKLLGPDHPDTALTVAGLGALSRDETLLRRALGIFERSLDPAHPLLASCRVLAEEMLTGRSS